MALLIVSICVGLVVGILSGLLGIGGGTIMVPVFKLGYGLAAIVSTATSLFTIIPTAISGSITHIRNKTCIPQLGLALGVGGALTSPIGVRLANISPDWLIMLAAALVIAYSAFTMLKKALKAQPSNMSKVTSANSTNLAAEDSAQSFEINAKTVFTCVLIGALAGVMSGYVGVGGGFLMVPLMMQILNLPMKKTSGTSLIAIAILAIPGVITQALAGNVNWAVGICVAVGTVPGAIIGAKLIKRLPERTLRFVFSAMLFFAAVALVVNQLV